MNLIRDTLSVAWKELQVLLKDRGSLFLFLLLPLLVGGLVNAPQIASWNSEKPSVSFNLVVVNEDDGVYG